MAVARLYGPPYMGYFTCIAVYDHRGQHAWCNELYHEADV